MAYMKLAKSKEKEIEDINLFFREIAWLSDELNMNDYESSLINEDYELLSKFNTENAETFLSDICRHSKNLFWEKLIMNVQTLLDNCACPNSDTVDFNEDIKKGFSLLELQKSVKKCNHKKDAIVNEQGNTIGSYCSECDIFYNQNGDAISCR